MPQSRLGISRRAVSMPASPIRRLAPWAAQARAAGKRIYELNIGQPDIPTPREILDRIRSFDARNVAYGPSQGLPEFIEALRAYYAGHGIEVAPEEIFVTTGGSEAILFVLGAIADPGDEVLVFEPFYTNYNGFAAMMGVVPVAVTTRAQDGYHLPPRAEIEARITDRTRAILICSPNNPTGTVYTDDEMETLAAVCRARDLYLVSDEVYREFAYDGRRQRSALSLPGIEDRVVMVDSLSKRVSLCGARVGNIVTRNREILEHVLKFGQARLCPPTLGQVAGSALAQVPPSYMQSVLAQYQRRRDVVFDALSHAPGVTLRRPEGAFYLCVRIPVDDAERFAIYLLREFDIDGETVQVAPADGFYATPGLGKDEVRIAYVLEEAHLERAMRIFDRALEVIPDEPEFADRIGPLTIQDSTCTVSLYISRGSRIMANRTTYTQARAKLASLCDHVAETREPYVIERRNGENVALISEAELNSLLETAHLLRSPGNARRLASALERALGGKPAPSSLQELRRSFGLDDTKD